MTVRVSVIAVVAFFMAWVPLAVCAVVAVMAFSPSEEVRSSLYRWYPWLGPAADLVLPVIVIALAGIIKGVIRRSQGRLVGRKMATAAQLVALVALVFCSSFAVALPLLVKEWDYRLLAECQAHMSALERAVESYALTHANRFPEAARWTDELAPYLADKTVLHCPADIGHAACSYAFNSKLSGLPRSSLANAHHLVLLFESDHGRNAHGGAELLPRRPRHDGMDVFLCADYTVAHAGRDTRVPTWVEWSPRPSVSPGGRSRGQIDSAN